MVNQTLALHPIRALVIGDFMLDTYTTGRVRRISPEAPVPVLEVLRRESRPGGAGNVVLSLIALGSQVIVAGRIGADPEGEQLQESLIRRGAKLESFLIEESYRTPVKNRLIAESQQLLRVDTEVVAPLSSSFEKRVLERLALIVPTVDVIAMSDYGKGFLTSTLIAKMMSMAAAAAVPVIVDPKGLDFSKYRGATVLKPNVSEAYAAASMERGESLDAVAGRLLKVSEAKWLLITRSEEGSSLFSRSLRRKDFPVRSREVKDVTGAGDTVLAVMSAGIANGFELPWIAQLANVAAGMAIERVGCATITVSELTERLMEQQIESPRRLSKPLLHRTQPIGQA